MELYIFRGKTRIAVYSVDDLSQKWQEGDHIVTDNFKTLSYEDAVSYFYGELNQDEEEIYGN